MKNINRVIKIAKALADKSRYNILKLIAQNKEICCMEILQKSHLSQPAVSHHLKILLENELVSVRREGQYGYFSFNKKVLDDYLRFLAKEIKAENELYGNHRKSRTESKRKRTL